MARGSVGGEWIRGLGLCFTNPVGTGGRGGVGCVSVFGVAVVYVGSGLGPWSGRVGWCYVWVNLDSLCRWQVQLSVYCARQIPAHLRCTECSILLHLIDIGFL